MVATLLSLAVSVSAASGVSFDDDIRPILRLNCVECHHTDGRSPYLDEFPFAVESSNAGVTQENIVESIIGMVEPNNGGEIPMPPGAREKLNATEIALIRLWLEEGLKP